MSLTPCSFPAEQGSPLAASRNSSSRLLALELPPELMACSWKCTTIPAPRSQTDRTRFHLINCARCSRGLLSYPRWCGPGVLNEDVRNEERAMSLDTARRVLRIEAAAIEGL